MFDLCLTLLLGVIVMGFIIAISKYVNENMNDKDNDKEDNEIS